MRITNLICFVFVLVFFLSQPLYAQYYNYSGSFGSLKGTSEVRVHAGANSFSGDLGGRDGEGKPFLKDFNPKTVRPFLGISYAYNFTDWLDVNVGINVTRVTDADSLIKSSKGQAFGRHQRNLSFKSDIMEANAGVEFYPFQLIESFKAASLRPFIGAGVGVFHFNPKAELNGEWIELNPLHLEGQGFPEYPERKEYKLTQLYIPVTAGMRYRLSDNFLLALNVVFRKTFTDYIDDVSTGYIDAALFDKYLTTNDAALARKLYYRGLGSPDSSPTGLPRGESVKDTYTSVFFTVSYLFGSSE